MTTMVQVDGASQVGKVQRSQSLPTGDFGAKAKARSPRKSLLSRMRMPSLQYSKSAANLVTVSSPELEEGDREHVPPAPSLAANPTPPLTKHEEASIMGKWEVENKSSRSAVNAVRSDARPRPKPGAHPDHPYECLVFKGGGAKGAIYPGAIRALEDAGIMPHIKRFAGASAGALVAALLAAGLTSEQLYVEIATTDLYRLVLDQDSRVRKMNDLFRKFGMNPGNALYKHLGVLFHKYLGHADVTFQELYDAFGVELAVAVTNISRAAVELLHVKTAPNYPIRKAIRMSMSLPVALHPCRDSNIHSVVAEDVSQLARELKVATGTDHGLADTPETTEYYVDGGVLNNYPIDCFDGWWLSMEKDDNFFKKVIGTNGHKNYVERHGKLNSKTMGFRLAAAHEPDAMHSRLGNDALELKVRHSTAAYLPSTTMANKYALHRDDQIKEAKARLKLDKELRASMDWVRKLRSEAASEASKGAAKALEPLYSRIEAALPPPKEVLSALGVKDLEGLVKMLGEHHARSRVHELSTSGQVRTPTVKELIQVLQRHPELKARIETIYRRTDLADDAKLAEIQSLVVQQDVHAGCNSDALTTSHADPQAEWIPLPTACDEIEELLEMMGEDVMKRLCGMAPKEISTMPSFINRMIEAIQMTNDERVQTKENYSRTCMVRMSCIRYPSCAPDRLDTADWTVRYYAAHWTAR